MKTFLFFTLSCRASGLVANDPSPKRRVMETVSALQRQPSVARRTAVLDAIRDLEAEGSTTGSLDGRWSLIFSTQLPLEMESTAAGGSRGPLQFVTDSLYGAFFKVAPALAGAQADGGGEASNEQRLDLASRALANRVRIPLPGSGSWVELCVQGEVTQAKTAALLDVKFRAVNVKLRGGTAVTLPLPSPVGTLRTTHCDDDLRVSRGGRGGVFVLKRIRGAAF